MSRAAGIPLRLVIGTAVCLGACGDPGGTNGEPTLVHPMEMGLPEPSFTRPDPTAHQTRLDNGLVAYIAEDRTAPLVTVAAVVSAGYAHDVRAGAAEALAHSLRTRGPSTMTAGDFRAGLARMVADYSVQLGPEETTISIQVPSEDWREALLLLADLLRSPAVSPADIASFGGTIARPATAGAAGESYEGSLAAAVELFHGHLFRGHPFGDAPAAAQARALTPPAVRAFHRRHFTPGSVTLAIGGSVDREEASSALAAEFGDWDGSADVPSAQTFVALDPDASATVWTYPIDKLQGWVVLGHELPVVPLEDQAPLQVMNYVLGGGHFDTRLFRATRDRRGLTNDDSGFLEPGVRGPGSYTFRTYGRPEVVRLLVELTLQEISRIRREPISSEELFVARGALADGEFTLRYRTGAATALTLATEWSRYGDHQRSATYQERIRAVSVEDVNRVANQYLDPDRMDLVVLGPVQRIQDAPTLEQEGPLSQYGTVVDGR